MKPIKSFLLNAIGFSVCSANPIPASAQIDHIESDGIAVASAEEDLEIVLKRARVLSELAAIDRANLFIENFVGELSREEIRAITAKILKIESSEFISEGEGRYNCHLVATVSSDDIPSVYDSREELTRAQEQFERSFKKINSSLEDLKRQFASATTDLERKTLKQKIVENEREFVSLISSKKF